MKLAPYCSSSLHTHTPPPAAHPHYPSAPFSWHWTVLRCGFFLTRSQSLPFPAKPFVTLCRFTDHRPGLYSSVLPLTTKTREIKGINSTSKTPSTCITSLRKKPNVLARKTVLGFFHWRKTCPTLHFMESWCFFNLEDIHDYKTGLILNSASPRCLVTWCMNKSLWVQIQIDASLMICPATYSAVIFSMDLSFFFL